VAAVLGLLPKNAMGFEIGELWGRPKKGRECENDVERTIGIEMLGLVVREVGRNAIRFQEMGGGPCGIDAEIEWKGKKIDGGVGIVGIKRNNKNEGKKEGSD
jgi:hypothetical protein